MSAKRRSGKRPAPAPAQVKLAPSVRKVPERRVDPNIEKTARTAREVEGATQYRVTKADDGQRLDRWCKTHLSHIPYGTLQKLLRKGVIRVDGAKLKADARLKAGQVVSVKAASSVESRESSKDAVPTRLSTLDSRLSSEVQSWVLYKDKDIIILNKPYGLAVQGGSGIKTHLDMMLPTLAYEMDAPPKLVHRLDRDTSGVLVLARTREAAADLQKGFANKRLRKQYLALVIGAPKAYQGEIISRMEKAPRGKDSREVVVSGKEGKAAVTRYRVVESLAKKVSLVELEPVTGRTHQLRVHMAELGCPIIGDGKYGGSAAFLKGDLGLPRKLHLHAWKISLPRPDGTLLEVTAPLSPHMQESCKALNISL